jgi:hypothetical protein
MGEDGQITSTPISVRLKELNQIMSDDNDLMLCVNIGKPGLDGQDYYVFGSILKNSTRGSNTHGIYKFMAKPSPCYRQAAQC